MRVYFVRHGESEENTTGAYLGLNAKLTEVGFTQAKFVAERFTKIPVDTMLSSDMLRAKETARVIGERVSLSAISSELLRETRGPSELLGKNAEDEETRALREAWLRTRFSSGDEHKRHSDEESFSDIKKRALEALEYIIRYEADNILVVTHGTFLRAMLGVMLFGNDFSVKAFYRFRGVFSLSNTGITLCEYETPTNKDDGLHMPGKAPGWRVITWNDHAHLG